MAKIHIFMINIWFGLTIELFVCRFQSNWMCWLRIFRMNRVISVLQTRNLRTTNLSERINYYTTRKVISSNLSRLYWPITFLRINILSRIYLLQGVIKNFLSAKEREKKKSNWKGLDNGATVGVYHRQADASIFFHLKIP